MASFRIFLFGVFFLMPGYFLSGQMHYFPEEKFEKDISPTEDSDTIVKTSPNWIRELRNIIIIPPKKESETDTFNIESPSEIYLGVEGKVISKIRFISLEPFGPGVNDSTVQNVGWLGRTGNAMHVDTREFLIRNMLLFTEGDVINKYKLADSERFIRSQRYIDDVRIIAVPISDDQAEVIVITQDIFPYAVSAGTNFSSRANLSLTNRNILGLGVDVMAGVFLDSDKSHLMGYEARMRLNNIGHSFISLEANFLDKYENQRLGFMFNRDFYAPTTKYAGNLSVYRTRIAVNYYDPDQSYEELNPILATYNYATTWVGRSFQLSENPFNKQRNNITVSVGTQRTKFVDRPENSPNLYYQFQNRATLLGSLTYSRQAYYKTNLIYNFGRTEDIPYGHMVTIIAGEEFNELYNRPYLGAETAAGYFIPKIGYLSGSVKYGTFFRNSQTEQGTVDVSLDYFSSLYITGKSRHRTFAKLQYTRQLNNHLEDYLDIDGDYGIPGFRNDSVLGRQRLNLSLEQDVFTPWNIYNFRFVVYAFANLSWLGDKSRVFDNTMYSSFGIGIRIRNNRLIVNTLQIQLAYFPNIPSNSRFRYIHFSREDVLEPRNFSPKAPEISLRY